MEGPAGVSQTSPNGPLAFLSYSRADLVWVADLARELRRARIHTWMDVENLSPGERWRDAIGRALDAASVFVACVSRYSLESRWTGEEARGAVARGLRIVPLLLDGADPETLPHLLREHQAIRLMAPTSAERSTEAADAILRLLGRSRVDGGAPCHGGRMLVIRITRAQAGPAARFSSGELTVSDRLSESDLAAVIDAISRVELVRIMVEPGAAPDLSPMLYGAACARVGVGNVHVEALAAAPLERAGE